MASFTDYSFKLYRLCVHGFVLCMTFVFVLWNGILVIKKKFLLKKYLNDLKQQAWPPKFYVCLNQWDVFGDVLVGDKIQCVALFDKPRKVE